MNGAQTPPPSPSFLPKHPKRGVGVRRLNRVPVIAAASVVCVALGAVVWTYHLRTLATTAQQAAADKRGEAGKASILDSAPEDGVVLAGLASVKGPNVRAEAPADQPATAALPADPAQPGAEDDATKARRQAWQVYYAQIAERQRRHHESAIEAMRADMGGIAGGSGASSGDIAMPQPVATPPGMAFPGGQPAMMPGGAYAGGYGYAPPPALPDATGAREKQAFLAQRGSDGSNDTLLSTVRDPISPYLITAGDVIPVIMQGGADSDIPGQMVGRVVADVFDSATGRHKLIPRDSKVVGIYDSVVSAGQSRLPAVIHRIIFPDSQSISIGAMPAADQAGFAGLRDQLDRHVWEKFGNALVIAIAGAGVQVSQPQGRGRDGYDSQQLIAGSLGQQFGQLGQEYARSGLAIPNTIRIRPGYRFTIQVTKDMVLRPYVDQRTRGVQPLHVGAFVQ